MDFSTGPWTWVLPALVLTGLLLWFALGVIARGLEAVRLDREADRHVEARDTLLAELRALDARLRTLERGASAVKSDRPRAIR